MLLQTPDIERAKSPEVSHSLAKEYLQWQTMRVRQLLDFLQEQVTQNIATKEVIEAYSAEIRALADFPLLFASSRRGEVPWFFAGTDEMARQCRI